MEGGSQHSDTESTGRNLAFVCKASLCVVWIASCAPLPALLYYFYGCGPEGWTQTGFLSGLEDGWFIARLYSPLFVYPLLFGGFAAAALARPLSAAVAKVAALRKKKRSGPLILVLVGFAATLLGHAALMEFDRSNEAVWGVPTEVLYETKEGLEVRNYVFDTLKNNDGTKDGDKKKTPVKPSMFGSSKKNRSTVDCVRVASPIEPSVFDLKLKQLMCPDGLDESCECNGKVVKSDIEWFYIGGFFFQAVLFLTMFLTLCVLIATNERSQQTIRRMGLALLFSSVWPILRLAFLRQKLQLYETDVLLFQNYILVGLFVLAYVFLVVLYWPDLGEKLSAVGGAISVIGLPVGAIWKPEFFADHLGAQGSLSAYIAILFLFGMILLPWILKTVVDGDLEKPGKIGGC